MPQYEIFGLSHRVGCHKLSCLHPGFGAAQVSLQGSNHEGFIDLLFALSRCNRVSRSGVHPNHAPHAGTWLKLSKMFRRLIKLDLTVWDPQRSSEDICSLSLGCVPCQHPRTLPEGCWSANDLHRSASYSWRCEGSVTRSKYLHSEQREGQDVLSKSRQSGVRRVSLRSSVATKELHGILMSPKKLA